MKRTDTCLLGIAAVVAYGTFSIALHAQVSVTTYHNDNARTGQNTEETILTPTNVNSSQFGKLFTVSMDGYVYAQPLYVANLTIAGGTHNILYVVTEHASIYAIDADSGVIYWQESFINPAAGITTVPNSDVACGDLVPEIGITSTPVIDPSSKTIYVLAKTKENDTYVQRLHALDLVTHVEKFGDPVVIQATVSGTGDGSSGGQITFDALRQHNRPGLLLENGHIIISWASHCDNGPYHGWVMSYSASTLGQEAVINLSPNGGQAGVWMSGDGVAADSSGNLFFATGNGTYDGVTGFGDSIVKLGPPARSTFPVVDWFTPYNQSTLNGGDTDLGSGGVLLLPDLPVGSAHQHLLVQMGKEGKLYLIDRDRMGKFCSSCTNSDTQIVEEIPGATDGVWGTPAYWNGSLYWGGAGDSGAFEPLKAFSFNANNSGLISTSPTSQSSKAFNFSAPSPSISANGNTGGILWAVDNSAVGSTCSGGSNCQILYAYDATNLASMLYNSSQAANNRDVPGGAVKFTTPTIANGKVFVGSQYAVSAYGMISLTPTASTPIFSLAPGSYTNSVSVTISDSISGATIHCTTDGSIPTASSPVCSIVAVSSTTTLKAIATASGYNPSDIAAGIYTIDPGATAINYGSGFTSAGLTFNGAAKLNGVRLRLTDGGSNEAGSAFVSTPINIQTFTTDFGFLLSNANADGFTFTIQGVGATALGTAGGGLGYGPASTGGAGGIASSVAVKFDIYSNAGEGTDSTGLYTNGASPTVPALDMTNSGVTLLSGDVFDVHMTYDGQTLTMTISNTTNSSQSFTASWPVDIPSIVGSNSAYLGFTGGTGGLTAVEDILDWTYVTKQPAAATPRFTPLPGIYSSSQTVTLSDTTPGATIHCTTNGTTPTPNSPVCTALSVSTTTTISAIAVATGYNSSAVASGTYTVNTSGNPSVNYGLGFSSTGLVLNGSAKLSGTRLRLTDGGSNEAGSGFYTTPLNIQSFTTDFSFQLTNPSADGFAFVLQNVGSTALGPGGGGLGYGPDMPGQTPGIGASVAVKFDLYSNAGEGTNSTGLYTDGASPTVPATALVSNVNLHSGDVFNVHIAYDGTTLTMTITDATTPSDTFTTSWTLNIPNVVGATTAYAGFTGGTGGLSATQDILTWTFTSGPPGPIQYEATSIPVRGSPDARSFTWPGFPDGAGEIADGTAPGAYLNFTVNVAAAGTYDIKVGTKKSVTRAIFQLSVDGSNTGPAEDEYSANGNGVFQEYDLGNVTFTIAGNHSFTFTAIGHNSQSTGYSVCFDYIKLTPQ